MGNPLKIMSEKLRFMYADLLGFIAASLILISASVSDIRRREVSDGHWKSLVIVAIVLSAFRLDAAGSILYSAGCLSMAIYAFVSLTPSGSAAVLSMSAILMVSSFLVSGDISPLVAEGMCLMAIAMYHTGIMAGGADVKALMALSMAFPAYPEFGGMLWDAYPFQEAVLNPAMSALILGLLITVIYSLPTVIRNAATGVRPVHSRIMSVSEARDSFVWPLEDIVDGELKMTGIPDDPGDVYDRLEKSGIQEVRVAEMIPFIVPLTAGFLISVVFGCPLSAVI